MTKPQEEFKPYKQRVWSEQRNEYIDAVDAEDYDKIPYFKPMTKPQEDLQGEIGIAMGAASMCWKPRPSGVFQSDETFKIAKSLEKSIDEYVLRTWEKVRGEKLTKVDFLKAGFSLLYTDEQIEYFIIGYNNNLNDLDQKFKQLKKKG